MSWKSSRTEPELPLPDFVTVGRIRRPHGIRGEVVVDVLSDVEGRFAAGGELEVVLSTGERQRARVATVEGRGRIVRLRLEGVETRDQAEELRDALLEISRLEVPPAPQGSFYYFELVGCECMDQRRGTLGRVEEVLEDGGGLLLKVADDEQVLLIPFVEAYVCSVNVAHRRIEVDLPEGLIEACASRS